MPLRDYQQNAVDSAIQHMRQCTSSFVIEAPTGAGKSWIIAYIADWVTRNTGKKTLVLAPSKELVEQDREKYLATGNPASLYSASVGQKELRHPVVFGSPLTVANSLHKFGSEFGVVLIDEAQGITPTLIGILEHIKQQNPKVRIGGLTATPYRLGTGYIYACDYERGYLGIEETINPYFEKLIYRISAKYLIEQGHLTPPVFEHSEQHYDTSGLKMKSNGQWDSASVDQAFTGHGRKTSLIVADVVEKARTKKGVMFFAATVQHAKEIMASLPAGNVELVTGATAKQDRESIINRFKAQQFKYIVSIGALTTGFDAAHVDVVAILRATESASLLQQIIGRGLRLNEGKPDCLILDYAENVERHFPNGDVFSPEIRTATKGESVLMEVGCPDCGHTNEFSARKNDAGFEIDNEGYFVDLAGDRIETEGKPLPAHYGRRCTGHHILAGKIARCSYKWSFKECPKCEAENDIAARYCTSCRAEIVDPNEKLKEFAAKMANDPYATKFSDVLAVNVSRNPGKGGKPDNVKVEFVTPDTTITDYYHPEINSAWLREKWQKLSINMYGKAVLFIRELPSEPPALPTKIAYKKERDSKYIKLIGAYYEDES